jgi:site-specific recombinase XerD
MNGMMVPTTSTAPAVVADATGELATRLAEYSHAARGALAEATARALRSDIRLFSDWCAEQGRVALPAEVDTVVAFIDAMAETRKAASVRRYVSSIATMHKVAGLADPTKAEASRLALRRMARAVGTRQKQAAPIGQREADRIEATAGNTPADLRNVALVLTMRDMLARRSEVVAVDLEHVTFNADGSATVLVERSKTDQTGEGVVLWLGPATVDAIRRWTQAAGITSGALFRSVNKAGKPGGRLPEGDVARILKRVAARAGLDASRVSGHSARVGMAQDLAAAGAELVELMTAGRWKSSAMPARYSERIRAGRGAVARYHERRGR